MTEIRWERNQLGFVLELQRSAQQRIVGQVANLRRFAQMGAPARGRFEGKHRLIIGPYSVVYEYDSAADTVSIIAVARGGPTFR